MTIFYMKLSKTIKNQKYKKKRTRFLTRSALLSGLQIISGEHIQNLLNLMLEKIY